MEKKLLFFKKNNFSEKFFINNKEIDLYHNNQISYLKQFKEVNDVVIDLVIMKLSKLLNYLNH